MSKYTTFGWKNHRLRPLPQARKANLRFGSFSEIHAHRVIYLWRLFPHHLDNQLTSARPVIEVNVNDLLPGSQSQTLLHEWH